MRSAGCVNTAARRSVRMRMLTRVYLLAGAIGVALGALFARALVRLPGNGPHEIALAIILATLTVAQAVPAAGLPAALWMRVPAWHPERWPRGAWLLVVGLSVASLALGGVSLGVPILIFVCILVLGARLAARRRGWIAFWLVGTAVAFALAVTAIVAAHG